MAGLAQHYGTARLSDVADFAAPDAREPELLSAAAGEIATQVTFDIVGDRTGLEALEADWNALFDRAGMPHQAFQTFNWCWSWAQTFLTTEATTDRGSRLAILTGRCDNRLVTLWPMVIETHGGLRELSWLGEPVSQYGDVLLDPALAHPDAVLRAAWDHLATTLKPDLARLRKVRADAAIAPLLQGLGSLRSAELEAPFIDLTRAADFAAYEERFPTRARRNRRRQMRRLEETGKVCFRHLDQGTEATAFATQGIELKRRWLIDQGQVSPALADVRMQRFMALVASGGPRTPATRVSVLQSDDKAAAIQIGFTCKNTRILHVIVYDRAFEKTAAGVLNLEEAIRHGFTEGLARIDLLAPKAAYKMEWADGAVGIADHAIGLSITGKLYARVYLGMVRDRLKGAVERLPQGLRRWLVAGHLRAAARRVTSIFALG
jgi:CelD/BcsL family acetyltransferase involved in cellulose biosynthesis